MIARDDVLHRTVSTKNSPFRDLDVFSAPHIIPRMSEKKLGKIQRHQAWGERVTRERVWAIARVDAVHDKCVYYSFSDAFSLLRSSLPSRQWAFFRVRKSLHQIGGTKHVNNQSKGRTCTIENNSMLLSIVIGLDLCLLRASCSFESSAD
jgi:hypothetical protein